MDEVTATACHVRANDRLGAAPTARRCRSSQTPKVTPASAAQATKTRLRQSGSVAAQIGPWSRPETNGSRLQGPVAVSIDLPRLPRYRSSVGETLQKNAESSQMNSL
jgi:hypothetical protein